MTATALKIVETETDAIAVLDNVVRLLTKQYLEVETASMPAFDDGLEKQTIVKVSPNFGGYAVVYTA